MQSLYLTRQLSDGDKPAVPPPKADTLETWIVRGHCDKGSLQVQPCKSPNKSSAYARCGTGYLPEHHCKNPKRDLVYARCDKGSIKALCTTLERIVF